MTLSSDLNLPARTGVRGFTLMEMAIVICVFGLVVGSIWGVAATVREKSKREQLVQAVMMTVKNVRSYYQSQASINGDFATLTNTLLRQNVIPQDMIRSRSAGTLVADHPWGANAPNGSLISGAGGGFAVDANGVANNGVEFRLRLRGLPLGSCMGSVPLIANNPQIPGLDSVWMNGTAMQLPIAPAGATLRNACNQSAGATIDFVYRLRAPSF